MIAQVGIGNQAAGVNEGGTLAVPPHRERAAVSTESNASRLGLIAVFAAAVTALPCGARAQAIEQRTQLCAACHGDNGIPQQATTPVIWGQQLGYLYLQLRDYKNGTRKNDQMSAVAAVLERDDMLALAQYFSQKPWPNLQQKPAPESVTTRALVANKSIGCTGCHQDGYRGEGTQPRLAGQRRDYLARTMADFRTGTRGNNPGMTDLMNAASEDDLAALADYLAGL